MSSSYSTYNIHFYSNDTIEKLAEELLTHTGFLNKGSIDIVQLAKELGLNVFTADLGGRDILSLVIMKEVSTLAILFQKQENVLQ